MESCHLKVKLKYNIWSPDGDKTFNRHTERDIHNMLNLAKLSQVTN